MDAKASALTETAFSATEPAKRVLDPFAEWRDCANQWDVSEVWGTRTAAVNAGVTEREETALPSTGG